MKKCFFVYTILSSFYYWGIWEQNPAMEIMQFAFSLSAVLQYCFVVDYSKLVALSTPQSFRECSKILV